MDSEEQFIYSNVPNSPTISPSATMLFLPKIQNILMSYMH